MGLRKFGPFGRLKKAFGQAVGIIAVSVALATAPSVAEANSKYAGIVVDAKTGKVLYANNANARRYPASTTKIMTLYVLFEELEAGRVSLNTKMKVSRYAAGRPPTKLGLRVGGSLRVKDAIYALITKSANDASTVIAEHISGSEKAFGRRMTQTARAIGMRNTTFRNPHGLPNSKQVTTAADLALLGRAIQDRFPKYYKYFNTRSYTYAGRRMGNHNKLLGRVRGVDGIKTGYTNASGFNLVTNVKRDNRQIVAVVLGGRTGKSVMRRW
ncbi:D-alanyl-D-alanine carboxypeptidase family protein [Pseudovibrio denitrificans]|uniref:D-alanyl-D-alanine carboxypeptidase family protein n=1 Tax=Pseudovibrio denitrificans TaxID=258256 RepID=UPI000AA5EFBF|nr:D-alanyl-D-alanine carboxypeptidase family protein [Pseudovibrio denitrificans]